MADAIRENVTLWSKGYSTDAEIEEFAEELGIADLLKKSPWELS